MAPALRNQRISESWLVISWLALFLFANLAGLLVALASDPAGFDDGDTRVHLRTAWTVVGLLAGTLLATAVPVAALTTAIRYEGRRWHLWVVAIPLLTISGLAWATLVSAAF